MRLVLVFFLFALLSAAQPAGKPEAELAAAIKAFFTKTFSTDWAGVEKIPGIQWAPLPPASLTNCLPNGDCYARQGKAIIGGKNMIVVASGARLIVQNLMMRNGSAPFGEPNVLAALKEAGITPELARCPVAGTPGGTNWYRLKSAATNPGVLSIQSSCNGRPCEGLILSQGADLPQLQPAQLRMYSDQCSAPPTERRSAAAAGLPHEQIAQALASLVPQTSGPALSNWKALIDLTPNIKWNGAAPKKWDLTMLKNDPNPVALSGSTEFAGRKFSVLASGSPTEAKVIYLEEMGMHPRGEHVLGEIYKKELQVQTARCGPVYTESTNNWYSLKSANTHPIMLRQSIRYEGQQVQDEYALRLDGTLPTRDPRDRDPGVGGCR